MKQKVLVLGVSGMLGSMVFDYLSRNAKYDTMGTVRSLDFPNSSKIKSRLFLFDAEKDVLDEKVILDFKPNYIINCIGIIKPHCKDDDEEGVTKAIKINALMPHKLSRIADKCGSRIIQIATDCVYSGIKGSYVETDLHDALDVYGKTKSLGEVTREKFLNIRCSIIGPELKGKLSLLEWFLKQPSGSVLKGFTHHRWNGITTLQFAELCKKIIDKGTENFDKVLSVSKIHHYLPNRTVNKFELLNIFNEIFKKNFTIEEVSNVGLPVDRTINTNFFEIISQKDAGKNEMGSVMKKLKNYMSNSYFK